LRHNLSAASGLGDQLVDLVAVTVEDALRVDAQNMIKKCRIDRPEVGSSGWKLLRAYWRAFCSAGASAMPRIVRKLVARKLRFGSAFVRTKPRMRAQSA
jgi:hypothetical protein